jgi:hypothetical protein
LLADGNTAQKVAKRARIVPMSADGHGVVAIIREAGVSENNRLALASGFGCDARSIRSIAASSSVTPSEEHTDADIGMFVFQHAVSVRVSVALESRLGQACLFACHT